MDPFFDIDIPRLERSAEAAKKRAPSRRGSSFSPDDLARFFSFLGNGNVSRVEKQAMRRAANLLIGLLDVSHCGLKHCEEWSSRHPCNCCGGKNPKRCPKVKAYNEKKHANHEECECCKSRSGRYSDDQYWCRVKRNADRPGNCPKVKRRES